MWYSVNAVVDKNKTLANNCHRTHVLQSSVSTDIYNMNCLLQAWSHPCQTIFFSHSFRLKQQNQSHFHRGWHYKCLYYMLLMQTQQKCFLNSFIMASSKGGLQKDEQKRLVNSLWAWNTNTLRKHLWFVHPSVNLTFSVIFIFPFPGQAQREQILHVLKICHHIP